MLEKSFSLKELVQTSKRFDVESNKPTRFKLAPVTPFQG